MDLWTIDEHDYPSGGTPEAQLRFLVRYAILAPSGHNTQPWLFRVRGDRLELFADRTRALPVVDPVDRAMVISCGAALANLMVAAERFGMDATATLLPDAREPDLLAAVRSTGARRATSDPALFSAITKRRTTRRAFEPTPVPEAVLDSASAQAASCGAGLHWIIEPERKHRAAELIAEGDRLQCADPSFRRELASWVRSRRAAGRDGMSGYAFGMPDLLSPVGALIIRTFDMGTVQAAKDQALAEGSPAIGVFTTRGDGAADWLAAGQAMQRALLSITAAGLTSSYLNQPIEVPALRPRLAMLLGTGESPQILIRVGRGPELLPAVRRAVEDVMLSA
ncbi:MAG: nitroreductase family protein [Planctomycetaceae bacterium]|jgi:nitroreductase|nr:nitroreductase family protein [Phycisphaerales bacterium]MCE2654608.1 nitroreductase family protein [Planctomycetaceae bacterium]